MVTAFKGGSLGSREKSQATNVVPAKIAPNGMLDAKPCAKRCGLRYEMMYHPMIPVNGNRRMNGTAMRSAPSTPRSVRLIGWVPVVSGRTVRASSCANRT